ncbi:hypothetical protein [Paenibacillus sp. N3.4]|uniref:hypothetical protein n=1 Tax=Paenibacillus sp. N3.4 TaxID=2603222 RepID=UPI001650478A|nr:hypothetical protein [Paenibacillus sp. N3.4]
MLTEVKRGEQARELEPVTLFFRVTEGEKPAPASVSMKNMLTEVKRGEQARRLEL